MSLGYPFNRYLWFDPASAVPTSIRLTQFQITSRGANPVTLDEAKAFLNYSGDEQDAVITGILDGAVRSIESRARRPLSLWTCEATFDCSLGDTRVLLPYPPVVAVSAISYKNDAGGESVLAADKYEVATGENGFFRVIDWPDDVQEDTRFDRYKVEWQCGASAADLPADLKMAVKFIVNEWFAGRVDGKVEQTIEALISPHVVPLPRR